MGEIAKAMLEGDLCAECGCTLECAGFGIPIFCHDCHSEDEKSCKKPVNGIMCERFYS